MLVAKTPPHLFTLVCLTALSTLSLNMFLPSLANIADDLGADYATVSFAVAGYLAVTAVIQLIIGPLSDRIGRRPVLLTALIVFTGASVGCALAQNVWVFLVFRMLQGGITTGYALSLAIVRDTTSERKAAGLIGYISMAMAIAPMLGPMLGGVLDSGFGWRANFYFYAITGSLLFALCWIDLGETRPDRVIKTENLPETSFTLIREPLFWAYSLCSAFSTSAFYIFLAGAPLVAKLSFGVTTAELGFYIGTITAGFLAGSFIAGRFSQKYKLTTLMLTGRLIACGGLLVGLVALTIGWISPLLFFGSTIFVGIGNGITMPGSNTGAMSVRPNLAGTAAGLNGAMTVASGAVLTTVTGLVLTQNSSAQILLALMLFAAGAGLLAVIWAMKLQSNKSSIL